jgi:hypothetical protein
MKKETARKILRPVDTYHRWTRTKPVLVGGLLTVAIWTVVPMALVVAAVISDRKGR